MPWTAVTINAAVDTDTDGYSDALEILLGSDENVIGETPESLVIDMTLTVGAGSPPQSGGTPAGAAAQSCNDGVDNDGDTKTDAADNDDLGCDPTDDSYAGDADNDGVADASDNCGKAGTCSIRNPEQVDSDADTIGDPCDEDIVANSDGDTYVDRCDNCPTTDNQDQADAVHPGDGGDACEDFDSDGFMDDSDNCPDDANADQGDVDTDGIGDACDSGDFDGDNFSDAIEWYLPTQPDDDCTDVPGNPLYDAWPLDNNIDTVVTVVGDVLPYKDNIGAAVSSNPSVLQRLDLNADGMITVVGDVLEYAGMIGEGCT
jgi:hypothetical protein